MDQSYKFFTCVTYECTTYFQLVCPYASLSSYSCKL
jgi:hypothetical protein